VVEATVPSMMVGVGVLRSDMGAVNFIGKTITPTTKGAFSFGYGTGREHHLLLELAWGDPSADHPSVGSAVNQGVVYMFALDMDTSACGPGKTAVALRGSLTGRPRSSRDSMHGPCWRHALWPPFRTRSAGTFMGPFTTRATGFQSWPVLTYGQVVRTL
jgi:hypothetical protein